MRRTLAVAAALGVLLAACSGGSSKKPGEGASTPRSTAVPAPAAFILGATPDVQAVGDGTPTSLAPAVTAAVKSTLDAYLSLAVVAPIRTGQKAGDLGPVFTGPALTEASGPDRPAMVDEGLIAAPTPFLSVPTATADLTALVGPDGPVVISAQIHVSANATGAGISVDRTGELVLSPDGNAWKVSGYTITVTRQLPSGTTTTTAAHR